MINLKKDKNSTLSYFNGQPYFGDQNMLFVFLPHGLPNILLYNKLVKEVIWVKK